jgi:hypothetical protein
MIVGSRIDILRWDLPDTKGMYHPLQSGDRGIAVHFCFYLGARWGSVANALTQPALSRESVPIA